MAYEFRKSRPLNDRELRRLRFSVRLAMKLREAGEGAPPRLTVEPAMRPGGARRQRLLRDLFFAGAGAEAPVSATVLDWALCYTPPRVLVRLFATLCGGAAAGPVIDAVAATDPGLLLAREHITPDYQAFRHVRNEAPRVVVCFTGNAYKLNVPVQLFHCLAVKAFDQLVYLRDDRKQQFVDGVPGLGDDPDALADALAERIPRGAHVAIVATSSGGLAATRTADRLGAARVALFSPTFSYRGESAEAAARRLDPANVRLYLAAGNTMDAGLARAWSASGLAGAIREVDSASHGTLSYLVRTDLAGELLGWLAGESTA